MHQVEFNFAIPATLGPRECAASPLPESQFRFLKPFRRIEPAKASEADKRFRQRVKRDRGYVCEACGSERSPDILAVHHILESRLFPKYLREAMNVLVLCTECHDTITRAESTGTQERISFYARLPHGVRSRHLPFLEGAIVASPGLICAFRQGWF